MLVLSRKLGERIYVGDNIVFEVRRISGNRVTLAIDAPKSIRILRGELKEAVSAFQPMTSEQQATVRHAIGPEASAQQTLVSQITPVEHVETFIVTNQSTDSDDVLYSI